ncbi:MAG: zinc-ribbon domain containing protein [Chloroflexota bacterium]
MSYTDQTLSCRDCGQSFVFTTGEQEFYASRGFTNQPSRCEACRGARKAGRGSEGSSGSRSGANAGRGRDMFTAVCASCGQNASVPFQPRNDRPVYCSDCFSSQRGAGGRGRS